jgi:hypothetical protein
MPTVYQCLCLYCNQENKPILKLTERGRLGRTVNKHYYNSGHSNTETTLLETTYKFKVVNYPEHFTPFILALIHGYYIQRKRPRIKSKPRKVFTSK